MSNNTLEDTSNKKSVRVNSDDQDNVEKAGYDLGTSASTLFSELAKDAAKLREIQEEKRKEVREKREEARDLEDKYNLDDL